MSCCIVSRHIGTQAAGWLFGLTIALLAAKIVADDVASPLSPSEAQTQFRLADETLQIELAAAEPNVIDPVAIRFDEDGRMWVVEMRDYPQGPPDGGKPLSTIRVLEDKDGDGYFESARMFADSLSFVTGLQPWKGGVFVTLSGALVYMKDTDGDGRSDVEETWYEGFAEQNSQLRANHPRLALDNWVYVANGLRGGKIFNRRLNAPSPVDISGMDFRFDPLTGQAEVVSGNGQFGLCFDDWGNRFTCSNRNPVRHVVIEDRYLKANPQVAVSAVVHDVAAFAEKSRIFPISRAWTTSNLHAGQFTAACGVYIYRGDVLPEEYRGNAFTCDPTGNLIHREIIEPVGPTFTSRPAYADRDFLTSPDEWFRPVNMELGPDGALYVVDMYRCVIEHPDWVPDELKQRPDTRYGDDRGRIWRIVSKDTNPRQGRGESPANKAPLLQRGTDQNHAAQRYLPLSSVTSEQLVRLLDHPNAWHRETAQRLLVERQERGIAPQLQDVATSSQRPVGRIHSLWTLRGMDCLGKDLILSAIADDHPQVRRQALILAEPLRGLESSEEKLLADRSALVRFQARMSRALARAETDEPLDLPSQDATFKHVHNDASDPWQRAALRLLYGPLSGAAVAHSLLIESREGRPSDGEIALVSELAEGISFDREAESAARATTAAMSLLDHPEKIEIAIAALHAFAKAAARQRVPLETTVSSDELVKLRRKLKTLVATKSPLGIRSEAVSLLGYLPESEPTLVALCAQGEDQAIRIAAISALARQSSIDPWPPLLDTFAAETPGIRRAIINGLLANADRTGLLLDAIEAGAIKTSELDVSHVNRLTNHRDGQIKQRVAKLFAAATPQDRAQALAEYQPVLKQSGDAKRGQLVFEKNCAACHKIGEIGVNVAPDISDSRTKSAAQLLTDILQPNRAIDNNYVGYTVRLVDGTVQTGILTTETATSITLRQQGGKDVVISRSEIDELKSTGQSLMPEGLERQIPRADMADLLSFIKNWRYLDGRIPIPVGTGSN